MRYSLCAALAVLAGLGATAPAAAQPVLQAADLPAYEQNLDHAGLIRAWNPAARARGERVYQAQCHACHGDGNLPGSLPDAPRFAEHAFPRGADPLSLYRTLTLGWGRMPPQTGLTPREKYDVIHYLREAFLAGRGPTVSPPVDDAYVASLPLGRERGPEPVRREPWREMDYGPYLIGTYELADEARRAAAAALRGQQLDQVAPCANLAQKGVAIRLDRGPGGVAAGRAWVVFEHDTLRLAGGWTGEGFIDWEGINFNGRHVVRPRTVGTLHFETADAPGWADPTTGGFVDRRVVGVDGRRFGPLPRDWMRYRGLHRHGERVVLEYEVGGTVVLETHDLEGSLAEPVFVRTLNVARSSRDLLLRVADEGASVSLRGGVGLELGRGEGFVTLRIPAGATPARLALRLARAGALVPSAAEEPANLSHFLGGGPSRWPVELPAPVVASPADGAFAWERLSLPGDNPWRARMRPGGFDFAPGGTEAFVCTWDGDVWRVAGLSEGSGNVRWRRIASGLFQPLGVRLRDGQLFVTCRDQLVRLHDRDGDGEADFLESFNSDHQVTEHFHEFAMGLQADAAGNLYYAKSARHARTPVVPQHGTLLRVSADGSVTDILANGFRAANGVCLNPDGSLIVTDQEGHWTPMNRVNWVKPGQVRFFGNMWSYGAPVDSSDSAMEQPLTWVDKQFDRSPSELLWVESAAWGPLYGKLLNLSYGTGRIEIVPHEFIGGTVQGGLVALPIPDLPTGVMRGRFHPENGHLYLTGMSAWGTNKLDQLGGFYRIRVTGKPAYAVTDLHARKGGIELVFSDPLDAKTAGNVANFKVTTWSLLRSEKYGSARLNVKELKIAGASLGEDRMKLSLSLPGIEPVQQMEIHYELRGADGAVIKATLQNTIHVLGETSK